MEAAFIRLTAEVCVCGSVGFNFQDNKLSRQTFVCLGGTFISGEREKRDGSQIKVNQKVLITQRNI